MFASISPKLLVSVDDDLAGKPRAEMQHGYAHGQLYAMMGASRAYGLIVRYGLRVGTRVATHTGQDTVIIGPAPAFTSWSVNNASNRWRGWPSSNWTPIHTAWLNLDKPAENLPKPLPALA